MDGGHSPSASLTPQLGSDETSIKDNGKTHWIWCITAAAFSVFHIDATRSRAVLEKLVGDEFAGYLNFDYFSANCSFAWNYCVKAQYCWAHLIRDIRFLENRFMELIGNAPSTKEAGNLAARFRTVQYTSDECDTPQNYDLSEDYFRFMFTDGVEPTNNHSEQQIRHCVIDRRITQGTRGKAGQRYHERMWTMITAGQSTTRGSQYGSFSCLHSLANPTRSNLE